MRLSPEVKSLFIGFVGFTLVCETIFSDAEKEKRKLLGSETNGK
jgi:hypothetical protein